jgi:hypothetical protein
VRGGAAFLANGAVVMPFRANKYLEAFLTLHPARIAASGPITHLSRSVGHNNYP